MHERTRFLTTAAALTVATVAIGSHFVQGVGPATETVFIPITPCRLVDTRPGDLNVGPRTGKIGEDEAATFGARDGSDGNSLCDIPATATAISTNTVAVAPTARSFMTLYPADVANPGTANLNYVADQAPTPNAANVPLSTSGDFNVYNAFGDVHLVIDVNGYYQPSSNVGAPGPAGAPGEPGAAGQPGTRGENGAPNRLTDEQIARHAWFEDTGAPATVSLGAGSFGVVGIATDGIHIFTTNLVGNSVTVIDPTTNAIVTTIPVPGNPVGIAFDGTRLFVTNTSTNAVTVIDPTTNTVVGAPIPLGAGTNPFGIVAAEGSVYTANSGNGTVGVIDTASLTLTTSVNVGPDPYDVEYDGTNVHVTRGTVANGFVVTIDPTTNTTVGASVATGDGSQGMVFTGQHLFVANGTDQSLSRFDPVTRTVVATYPLTFAPSDVTYDGRYLYIVDNASGSVQIFDPQNGFSVGRPLVTGPNPARIIFDGTNLWVTNFTGDSVTKLQPY